MKLLQSGAIICAVAVVLGAGFVASSRAQEQNPPLTPWEDKYLTAEIAVDTENSPKVSNILIGFYRQAIDDPDKLRMIEKQILSYSHEEQQSRFQLLQIEQNARLIELMKARAPK